MTLTIHRGTHEIGGTCIELNVDDYRLILDMGMPLVNEDGTPFDIEEHPRSVNELIKRRILPDIPGLYAGGIDAKMSLLLSHAHPDHYGLSHFIHPEIPVYSSTGTFALIEALKIFLPKVQIPKKRRTLPKWKPVQIGPFTVTAYLVDHAAPDALAFLIEADGKRIFYSGDLRASGRKGALFENLIKRPPRDIDYLLLEGTLIGREKQTYTNESAVEKAFVDVLGTKTNLALCFCSGQNVDRLVSAFKACHETKSILVIDLYTAHLLSRLHKHGISRKFPQHYWDNVRVFYWRIHAESLVKADLKEFLYAVVQAKINPEEIVEKREKILMLCRPNYLFTKITEKLPSLEGLEMIWSMWKGYLERNTFIQQFLSENRLNIKHIHTSGHATIDDLKRLAEAIKPKHVIPIHTFKPEEFQNHFDNVLRLDDGVEVAI